MTHLPDPLLLSQYDLGLGGVAAFQELTVLRGGPTNVPAAAAVGEAS